MGGGRHAAIDTRPACGPELSNPTSAPRAPAPPSSRPTTPSAPPAAPTTSPSVAPNPQRDARGYLAWVAARCAALRQYTLRFTRTERRGLFGQLQTPEYMRVWFRREPFSVRTKWLNTDLKYDESTYVANAYDGRLRFVTRWWTPPMLPPPQINAVDPMLPVQFGEARRPITEFGLDGMMSRMQAALERAGDAVRVTYAGVEPRPMDGPMSHHFTIEYDTHPTGLILQNFWFDAATDLPSGVRLRTTPDALDSEYWYDDIDPSVQLTDDDFLLSIERQPPAGAAP